MTQVGDDGGSGGAGERGVEGEIGRTGRLIRNDKKENDWTVRVPWGFLGWGLRGSVITE